jgi:hypothetical protein
LGVYRLDVVRVGDPADLPLMDHLAAGRHSPGVYMIRRHSTLPQLLSFLRDAAYASELVEWQDRIQFIP